MPEVKFLEGKECVSGTNTFYQFIGIPVVCNLPASPSEGSLQTHPSQPAGGVAALPDANHPAAPPSAGSGRDGRRGLGAVPGCCAGAMAASEAAAAGPTALASGALAAPAATRGAAAASGLWGPPGRLRGSRPRHAAVKQPPAGPAPPAPPARELIQPSVSELSRAVRTNILCTVRGCGKILPNSPALNMHLVKSHRLQVSLPPDGASPGLAPTKRLAPGEGAGPAPRAARFGIGNALCGSSFRLPASKGAYKYIKWAKPMRESQLGKVGARKRVRLIIGKYCVMPLGCQAGGSRGCLLLTSRRGHFIHSSH